MNKKIVITGATKGIGRAIALKFAKGGFDLALCARTKKDLDALKTAIKIQNSSPDSYRVQIPKSKILIQRCDVTKRQDLKKFAENIKRQFGAVDILVNNAGVFLHGRVYDEKEGTLETLMETNLFSAYHLSRLLLPAMIKRKQGSIFNLCSVASLKAYPNGGSYSISKFAMLGLSKALREELKEFNIKVTAIISGAALTESWKGTNLPATRFMKPEDVAQTIWDVYHLSTNTVVEEIILRPQLGDI